MHTAPKNLVLREANNYNIQFEVALGSSPIRGAVWVEAVVQSNNLEHLISINPKRMAFYDDLTPQIVSIELMDSDTIESSETIVVSFEIDSCDNAFMSRSQLTTDTTIYINVEPPVVSLWRRPGAFVPVILIACLLVVVIYVDHKRRQADSVWRIKGKA